MKPARVAFLVTGALMITVLRLPAPIQEIEESPTPAPAPLTPSTPQPAAESPAGAGPYAMEELREGVLAYLAQPKSSGDEFSAQCLGGARFELFDLRRRSIYISLPRKDAANGYPASMFERFLIHPGEARQVQADHGQFAVDGYVFHQLPEHWHLLTTQADNLKVDPALTLRFAFRRGTYTMSMREMLDFLHNQSLVGGLLRPTTEDGTEVINHGALVAVAYEASLTRFVSELVKDIAEGKGARELRVQRLLDFVSEEIANEMPTPGSWPEPRQRPNETLMTRRADAGNKAILLASLLRQLGEEPLIVYPKEHVTVAVARGHFPNANGLVVSWESHQWVIADSTVAKFQIGQSRLANSEKLKACRYVQPVKDPNTIVSLATGKTLSFR